MTRLRMLTFGVLLTLAAVQASAQEEKVTLEVREKWTNLMASSAETVSKTEFHVIVKAPRAFKGRVIWSFEDAETKRPFTKGRGEEAIAVEAGKTSPVKIPLALPTVKDGVVLKTQMIAILSEDGKKEPEAIYEKTLWLFPALPFADRMKWVKDLKITLFDADPDKGKTASMLTELKIPYEGQRNTAALGELKEGLVLVGEGVSFKAEPTLFEELVKAASRGLPVLCLAPMDGSFPLPVKGSGLSEPGKMTFQGTEIITQLDKRLDASAWAPKNQVVAASFAIKAEDNKVVGEVQEGGNNHAWLQLDYPDKKGRLVLCGFGVVRQWEASPTPRFLLSRLFEHVTELTVTDTKK